jgi:hypothetical protein
MFIFSWSLPHGIFEAQTQENLTQTMSLPTFTSTTTAEEVAAVFAEEIKGRNGFNRVLRRRNYSDSMQF